MSSWQGHDPLSDAWADAISSAATSAAGAGDAEALIRLSAELRRHGLARPTNGTLQVWTAMLTPLLYVAKRRDIVDKMIGELEQLSQRDEVAAAGAAWSAQLTYARARRALVDGHQLESALLYDKAVQAFDACGDREHACMHRVGAGFSFNISGAFERAERLLNEAITLGQSLGKAHVSANAKSNLGVSLARLGRFDDAVALEREARAYFVSVGDAYYRDASSLYLGFVYAEAGRWPDVDEVLAPLTAATIAADIRLCALATLGKSDLAQSRLSAALAHGQAAMTLLEELGDVEEGEETARLVFVKAALAAGDERVASPALRTARARILSKATNCADPSLREAFLGRVADNAEILRLAKTHTR